jgi:hypothetical protein
MFFVKKILIKLIHLRLSCEKQNAKNNGNEKMKKINTILILLFISLTSFGQIQAVQLVEPKKQDVVPFIKQLEDFKKSWAKKSKEKGTSYTLKSTVSSMIGQTITFMDIVDGKAVARNIDFDYRGSTSPENIIEKGDNLNKNRSGAKAKSMDEYILDAEKMLRDYQAGKIKGRLVFKAEGTTLMCLLTPYFIACHPGSGVRINSCEWKK